MMTTRRHFLQTSTALAGASALGIGTAAAKPLPFRYAFSAISWETDIETAVKVGEKLGFPGIEPFRHNIVNYLGRPLALKKFMDDHHIRMATCSNGGGPDFSGNFFDPAMADKTVADHISPLPPRPRARRSRPAARRRRAPRRCRPPARPSS